MKRQKTGSILCFITIFVLFVSGMCFENPETDSFFECNIYTSDSSAIRLPDHTVNSTTFCTQEMLGQSGFICSLYQIRRIDSKIQMCTPLQAACRESLPPLPVVSYFSVEGILRNEVFSQTAIIHFIQQQDGKKA